MDINAFVPITSGFNTVAGRSGFQEAHNVAYIGTKYDTGTISVKYNR